MTSVKRVCSTAYLGLQLHFVLFYSGTAGEEARFQQGYEILPCSRQLPKLKNHALLVEDLEFRHILHDTTLVRRRQWDYKHIPARLSSKQVQSNVRPPTRIENGYDFLRSCVNLIGQQNCMTLGLMSTTLIAPQFWLIIIEMDLQKC